MMCSGSMSAPHGERRDGGSAAVEFAILVPVLLLIVFSLINFGRAYSAKISATQAAREGVRRVALGEPVSSATSAANQAASADGQMASPTATVVATCPASATSSPVPTAEVDVTGSVEVLGIPFAGPTIGIKGKAVAQCGG